MRRMITEPSIRRPFGRDSLSRHEDDPRETDQDAACGAEGGTRTSCPYFGPRGHLELCERCVKPRRHTAQNVPSERTGPFLKRKGANSGPRQRMPRRCWSLQNYWLGSRAERSVGSCNGSPDG